MFIPRNNRFYAFFITMPSYCWYALTAVAVAATCAVWWTVLYMPLHHGLLVEKAEIDTALQQQRACRRLLQEVDVLRARVEELRSTMADTMRAYLPQKTMVQLLLTKGIEAHLSLIQCVAQEQEHKEWYCVQPIEIHFVGSYDQIKNYFASLALHEYPLRIHNITLSTKGNIPLVDTMIHMQAKIYCVGINAYV